MPGRRRAALAAAVALAGIALFLIATAPQPLGEGALPSHVPDPANGEVLYRAGSCFACHHPPKGAEGAAAALPVGGAAFATPVGTFYPGNLTPDDATGLGRWRAIDFLNAMTRGLAPDGRHYFPAFPYSSFAAMRTADVLDLWAYLRSLPAISGPVRAPSLQLRLARRGVGLWKRLAPLPRPFVADPSRDAEWNRGAYLVAAPGHCGECHTPRNLLMVPRRDRFLAGGPHPAGDGKVPSLRGLAARGRYKDAGQLAEALRWGETFGYDKLSSGGMGLIQAELAELPESDLHAIAVYLMSLD